MAIKSLTYLVVLVLEECLTPCLQARSVVLERCQPGQQTLQSQAIFHLKYTVSHPACSLVLAQSVTYVTGCHCCKEFPRRTKTVTASKLTGNLQ